MVEDLNDQEYEWGIEVGKIINKIKDDLLGTIARKKIIENRNSKEIENLTLKYLGDLKMTFGEMFRDSFILGKKHAKNDVKSKITQEKYAKINRWNLPPQAALKYFEGRKFYLTGTEKDYILKNIKGLLYDGIKTGKTVDTVTYNLEKFFDEKYQVEQLNSQGEWENIEDIPGRIETVVRTNFNDAYNQGRLTMYQDPDLKGFVKAYEFSAIIDARTSSICEELDGKIYEANDPIWSSITPPNHFNCRSTIIPIFEFEDYEVNDKPKELPDKGFGG